MILADKIIRLRKKNGWSQEELAERMDVSRQAVSKWESAQAIPDLERILCLSRLFGVSTDYLLKDEMKDEDFTEEDEEAAEPRITLADAHAYLDERKRAAWMIALATFLCILSPIPMILLGAMSVQPAFGISEELAGIVGLTVLFFFILCAVPVFIICGFRNEKYTFLDKRVHFLMEYGVRGFVLEEKKKFRNTYILCNVLATCICIFSPIPLIVSSFFGNEMLIVIMLAVLMAVAGIGCVLFIVAGVRNASMQKLLQEGEFAPLEKGHNALRNILEPTYWGLIIVIYLAWSFLSGAWHISWIVFVAGGVLFEPFLHLCGFLADRSKKDR
jgi:transcriptional regulator with XRE-family HTH domain